MNKMIHPSHSPLFFSCLLACSFTHTNTFNIFHSLVHFVPVMCAYSKHISFTEAKTKLLLCVRTQTTAHPAGAAAWTQRDERTLGRGGAPLSHQTPRANA